MKEIINWLKKIDISEKESLIYIKLIEIGPSTVSTISKRTGIPRTTVYENCDKLIRRGVIAKTVSGGRELLEAESTAKLLSLIEAEKVKANTKLYELDEIATEGKEVLTRIKNIEKKQQSGSDDINVGIRKYEGKQGAILVYTEAFSSPFLRTYVNLAETARVFPENGEIFAKIQNQMPKNHVKEIVDDTPASVKRATTFSEEYNFSFKASNIPKNLNSLNVLIYEGKVAMVNFKNEIVVTMIQNNDYYENSVAIFEYLWETL
ncbi:MAG: helix-turn-helix domain-containing protein [Candidatus Dojkabacteria bacterium]